MKGLGELEDDLELTIKDSDIQNMSLDVLEAIGDSFLDDGLLKEIPILGTLLGIGKLSRKIEDNIFAKKIITFLTGIKDLDQEKRSRTIYKINSSKRYRTRVGEKLILIIEKSQEYESVDYIAQLFCSFVNQRINYSEFVKASLIINSISSFDLKEFLQSNLGENLDMAIPHDSSSDYLIEELTRVGICKIMYFGSSQGKSNLFTDTMNDFTSMNVKIPNITGISRELYLTTLGEVLYTNLSPIGSAIKN